MIYDKERPTEKVWSEDGLRETTIEHRVKAPMLPEDYKQAYKRKMITKEELEECLKRPLWHADNKREK